MRIKSKPIILFLLFTLTGTYCFSQSVARSVISSGGRYATTGTTRIYSCIGEIAVSTAIATPHIFTEGFVQPPFVNPVLVPELNSPLFSVYPNPTTDNVTISSTSEIISIELTDVEGRGIQYYNSFSKSSIQPFSIAMKELVPGIYFIKILASADAHPLVYRIVKM